MKTIINMKDKMTKCMTAKLQILFCNTDMTMNGTVVKISLKHKTKMLVQILKWLLQQ